MHPTRRISHWRFLRLMEAYVVGLAEVGVERDGWTEAKRERALGVVHALSKSLGDAERLCSSESPILC